MLVWLDTFCIWRFVAKLKSLTKNNKESYTKKTLSYVIFSTNKIINAFIVCVLFIALLIGCYVLWDSQILHAKASAGNWKSYKPTEKSTLGYDDLVSQNPDVCAWITIYGTGVDFPVLWNRDTSYYLLRDAFGKNSSTGSIFVDGECSKDFSDYLTIVYGHHMEAHAMFGDLSLFTGDDFFRSHQYGNLYYKNNNHGLEIIGIIQGDAYDKQIYNTGIANTSQMQDYIDLMKSKAINWRDIDTPATGHYALLSTCYGQQTSGRILLFCAIRDYTFENTFGDPENVGPDVGMLEGLFGFPWVGWFALAAIIIFFVAFALWYIDRNIKEKEKRKNT